MRRLALVAICGLTAAAALTQAANADATPRGFWGVDLLDEPTASEGALIKRSGADVVRFSFYWPEIEAQEPGLLGNLLNRRNYDWRSSDAWVAKAARSELTVHALVWGSPRWLTPNPKHTPVRTAEGRRGWAEFVRAVVSRYGRGGSFWAQNPGLPERPIEIFQIWNEQNSAAAYQPAPNVEEYAVLLRLAAREIHGVDPDARVVVGGMFATPTIGASIKAWRFLRELYAVPGIRGRFDAVGLHPYSPDMRGIRWQVRRFLGVMRRAGDRRTPIEITEIGWSSDERDSHFFYVGEQGQARMLRRSFRLLARNRRQWRIDRVIWHAWRDTTTHPCLWCQAFGLVRSDLTPKPAHGAFRRIADAGGWRR